MYCLEQRCTFAAEFVYRVKLQDRVVNDDTTRYDDTDCAHQVQRVPAQPEDEQRGSDVDRQLEEDDERLHETLELGSQDEVHEQDGHHEDDHQLAQHLPVREERAGEVEVPGRAELPALAQVLQGGEHGLGLRHVVEGEGDKLAVLARDDCLEVFTLGDAD